MKGVLLAENSRLCVAVQVQYSQVKRVLLPALCNSTDINYVQPCSAFKEAAITAKKFTVLYCTVLHGTVQYCNTLNYTVLVFVY